MRPSRSAKMLPGCGSPWKRPNSSSCLGEEGEEEDEEEEEEEEEFFNHYKNDLKRAEVERGRQEEGVWQGRDRACASSCVASVLLVCCYLLLWCVARKRSRMQGSGSVHALSILQP